ncbi:MAG: ABC transporter permease subunit [Pseudomonadota bacterium]
MLRRWALRVPLGLLVLLTVAVIVGPSLSPHDHETLDTANALQPPSLASGHWFGTDDLGRDLFTRVMIGGRISLTVGVIATLVSIVIGVLWGATAGYIGGRVDHLMMRIVDVLYAIPFMFFVILLMVVFGRHFLLIFVAIGAINWLDMARIVRGQTISLRQREFVAAAELTGVGTATIIRRHIVPNLAGVVVVYATLTMPQVILIESFLSFLGLGVQEPLTSWGTLVYQGAEVMELAPWVLLLPGGFLTATLYAFNFLGDGLRDAIDQRYQR